MKDRSVEFPNRYRLTKVQGADDIYDLIPAPGEVLEEGSAFNKSNMLSDAVAEMIGLDVGSDPQVNDALRVLGRFTGDVGNVYVWKKRSGEGEYNLIDGTVVLYSSSKNNGFTTTWEASDAISVGATGEITLANSSTVTLTYSDYSAVANTLRGKYIRYVSGDFAMLAHDIYKDPSVVYYIPPTENAAVQTVPGGGGDFIVYYVSFNCKKVNGIPTNSISYVTSLDRHAYPDSGEYEGAEYEYMGPMGEKLRTQMVSYVGTGSTGSGSPSSVTFDFPPDIAMMCYKVNGNTLRILSTTTYSAVYTCFPQLLTNEFEFQNTTFNFFMTATQYSPYARKTNGGKTFEWYVVNSGLGESQFNELGSVYSVLGLKFS